ncbi:hypothetical protein AVEN_46789-1 [Araneus ventricosus]|uniref:Uncharacterized protein n=1 Tax=Araneus ventricosus TaxID=182803 RepID=A0A4Y2WVJ4_ARAVE|nr:hypothetical protein AVEN_46789-1 [Araneus ventricosus]
MLKNLLSCSRNLASVWDASNGDFTPAKPTPPDTLVGSGGRATNGRDKTRREESDSCLAHTLKYRRRKSRHSDVRLPFSIGQKSETDE